MDQKDDKRALGGRKVGLLALIGLVVALVGGDAWGHELEAEVTRESNLLRFTPPRTATDSERSEAESQACSRAKVAALIQLFHSDHSRSVRYSDCACRITYWGQRGLMRHWFECRVKAFGQDDGGAKRQGPAPE